MPPDPDTERQILKCIDDVLETLGKNGKEAFTSFLERNLGLKKEEIPRKPELFSKGLNLVFGEKGGGAIETEIVQKLLANLRIDSDSRLTLVGAIKAAKRNSLRNLRSVHTEFPKRSKRARTMNHGDS